MSQGSSLVQFMENRNGQPKKVFFNRAGIDGIPFRGDAIPLMKEAEFEAKTVTVREFKHKFFDISNAEEAAEYDLVMSKIANGWFVLRYQSYFVNGSNRHYVEWLELFKEDGTISANRSTEGLTYGTDQS